MFNESAQPDLGARDIRFTTKGKMLFAFVQGWPGDTLVIDALGQQSAQAPGKIVDIRMLGRNEPLAFAQMPNNLRIGLPQQKPATADTGIALRVRFA
jgi:alpha-L-fucosidase